MKSIKQYIIEFININNIKQYKYHPQTKDELIEVIENELSNGNTDLNYIDTSKITNMSLLFDQDDGIYLPIKQQKTLDISAWDVSNVEDMRFMFRHCEQFNSDLSQWDVSNVEDMRFMFCNCEQFKSDLSEWDVSNVKDMKYMFYNCEQFNSDLSNWHISKVENMTNMFKFSGLMNNEPSWYKK